MIRRIVAVKFRPGVTSEQIQAHRRASLEIADEVAQVRRLRWLPHVQDGESTQPRRKPGLDQTNLYDFDDIAGIQAFLRNPAHLDRARSIFSPLVQSRIVLNHELREAAYKSASSLPPSATRPSPSLRRLTLVKFREGAGAEVRSDYLAQWMELAQRLDEIERFSGLPHLPDGQDNANYDWVNLIDFEDVASAAAFFRHPLRAAFDRDFQELIEDQKGLNVELSAAEG